MEYSSENFDTDRVLIAIKSRDRSLAQDRDLNLGKISFTGIKIRITSFP